MWVFIKVFVKNQQNNTQIKNHICCSFAHFVTEIQIQTKKKKILIIIYKKSDKKKGPQYNLNAWLHVVKHVCFVTLLANNNGWKI